MKERFDPKDPEIEQFEREIWTYNFENIALNQEELQALLLRKDFAELAAEALLRSTVVKMSQAEKSQALDRGIFPKETDVFKLQEFGFFAYEHEVYYRKDRSKIYLSPLMEGDEHSVDMPYNFPKSPLDPKPNDQIDILLSFHCHPGMQSTANFLYSLNHFLEDPAGDEPIFNNQFSRADFRHFRYLADIYHSVILGIGSLNNPNKKDDGRILLASFKSYHAYKTLKPDSLYKKTSKTVAKTGNIVSAYEKAGLNTAVINIDLKNKPHLNIQDVEKASGILTRRQTV